MPGVVDQEPHSARAGDLVLPLLELLAVVASSAQLTLEPVMTVGVDAAPWVFAEAFVHLRAVARRDVAELAPMLGCVPSGEAQVPLRRDRRARYTIPAAAHCGGMTGSSKSSLAWSVRST